MKLMSGIIVVASGAYLILLALTIVMRRELAERFLGAFAGSARAHYTEQVIRLLVGAALLTFAPLMAFPDLFLAFGWVIVITTIGLLVIPWRWHHRFARWAIPLALRHIGFFAIGAALLGALVLFGVLSPFFF